MNPLAAPSLTFDLVNEVELAVDIYDPNYALYHVNFYSVCSKQ